MEETRILLRSLTETSENKGAEEDSVSIKALNLYKRLMIQANTQLGLFALPEETFGKYETLMRATLYEQMKKNTFDGEDPKKVYRRLDV